MCQQIMFKPQTMQRIQKAVNQKTLIAAAPAAPGGSGAPIDPNENINSLRKIAHNYLYPELFNNAFRYNLKTMNK